MDPAAIDAVIYFGSPHKDYYVWMAAPKIQHELGLSSATAFEVAAVSAGCPIALNVARSLLIANPALRNVLLVGASRESYLIDYRNVRSRFMFNFGDGAAAALVGRGPGKARVLATARSRTVRSTISCGCPRAAPATRPAPRPWPTACTAST
ncbi:MAG: hypothetical protein A6D92_02350 [Symbiobacterium thermophilum]|uniref:Beta-ketoacyl-[acyl-carrier-protein] synthase III N-terminal domain-containing protein n=1 Tax=Symbiobacterium thermophilum TaxID=2734 RepID=A0A1Y2T6B3_SYMTR|nr:MAG: hypothetical protein A6D92_02350 [Symbiobacterium thermophilum]